MIQDDEIAGFKKRVRELIDEAPITDSLVVIRYFAEGTITLGAQGKNLYRLPVMARALLVECLRLMEGKDVDEDIIKVLALCAAMLPDQQDIEPVPGTTH
jgi:hypothetical protein